MPLSLWKFRVAYKPFPIRGLKAVHENNHKKTQYRESKNEIAIYFVPKDQTNSTQRSAPSAWERQVPNGASECEQEGKAVGGGAGNAV